MTSPEAAYDMFFKFPSILVPAGAYACDQVFGHVGLKKAFLWRAGQCV